MKYFKWTVAIVLIAVMVVLWRDRSGAGAASGFDFSNPLIPVQKIMSGGPGKDGIPAILDPKFMDAEKAASFLKDSDRVIAISINGDSRAYPVKILNWHEIVIDKVGGQPVLITFCPLCGTGMMFDRKIKGKEYTFGVSGLLYESDLLFYDHQTDSLWSQIEGKAVTGKMSGSELKLLESLNTTWGYWKKEHPDSKALTTDTGHSRNYDASPYGDYNKSSALMFPVVKTDRQYNLKDMVIGVRINGQAKAYFFPVLKNLTTPLSDTVGGEVVKVHFDKATSTAFITGKDGARVPTVIGFWFAWYAFNSDTQVYKAE
jgi:hypothetical protein